MHPLNAAHTGRDAELVEGRRVARHLVEELENTSVAAAEDQDKRSHIMRQLFGSVEAVSDSCSAHSFVLHTCKLRLMSSAQPYAVPRNSFALLLASSHTQDSLPWIEKGFKCDVGSFIRFGR